MSSVLSTRLAISLMAYTAVATPLSHEFAITTHANEPILTVRIEEKPYYQRFKNKKRKKS
ncbi:MAG: hypothetical protein JRJ62_00250 [Deltaproteobacteria bacterium]|nr:hypothetical protein [Deltaproteobacteria bacterium]